MEVLRKLAILTGISLAVGLHLGVGISGLQSQQRTALPPTVLEAFVSQPDTKTTWSKFIARLDGGGKPEEVGQASEARHYTLFKGVRAQRVVVLPYGVRFQVLRDSHCHCEIFAGVALTSQRRLSMTILTAARNSLAAKGFWKK